MADFNNVTLAAGSSPTVYYKITYTKQRINNTQMQYDFTINCSLSTGGYLWDSIALMCYLTVNTVTESVRIKAGTNDRWNAGTTRTRTLSITCPSHAGNEAQPTYLSIRSDGSMSVTSGVIDTRDYTVTSSPLSYTAASAPTSFTIAPSPFANSITLSWNGASGGTDNSIARYVMNYRTKAPNGEWRGWATGGSVETTATSGTRTITDIPTNMTEGDYLQFNIRTQGSAGSDYYSEWKESNIVQKGKAPTAPTSFVLSCADENTSSTYIGLACVKGTWSGQSGTITGYQLAYRYADTNEVWTDWIERADKDSTISTITETWGNDYLSGYQVQFRVRLYNEVDGTKFYSSWKDSNKLKIAGGIRINVNGEQKIGTVWVSDGAGGVRRANRVYFNRNGVITESVC